jgi:hypothetical protein
MKEPGTGQGGYSSGAWPFKWVCNGEHPCPKCAALDGIVKSLDEWRASIQPGFHNHCHCTLEAQKGLSTDEGGDEIANQYCLYPAKREAAHWNTSAAKEVIFGSDIAVPAAKNVFAKVGGVKWAALKR